MNNSSGNIISIKQARRILGDLAKDISNDELLTLINDSETIVRMFIQEYLRSKKS